MDNLGQLGILDTLLGTEQEWLTSWQRTLDRTYRTPDYPVDRVIAQETQEKARIAQGGVATEGAAVSKAVSALTL